MTKAVLVRRSMALGDAILVTPLLNRLRRVLGDEAIIHVESKFASAAFDRNPDVNGVNIQEEGYKYNHIFNLDLAYERRPNIHIVDAYMLEAFGNSFWADKQQKIVPEPVLNLPPIDWRRTVLVHALNSGAKDRSLPQYFWDSTISRLTKIGLNLVLVGSQFDLNYADSTNIFSLVGRLSVNQLAYVISKAACFVGSDSGVSHIAGSTETPIVGLYTSVNPYLRLPWRKGILGWNCTALIAQIECAGCLHTLPPPATSVLCRRDDFACVDKLLPIDVVRAVMTYLQP